MNYYKDGNRCIATIGTLNLEPITKGQYETAMQETAKRQNVQGILYEKVRPMTVEEVTRLIIVQQINTIEVDDNTALRMTEFYPEWSKGQAYTAGFKVQYGGTLYKCLNAHTSQDDWTPAVSPSLFSKVLIPDENIILEWEQPDSTNPYMKGDKVTHNGKTWESLVDNNVWEPGEYGWTEVE